MKFKRYFLGLSIIYIVSGLIMWSIPSVAGDPGVFPDKVVVGSVADLSGPSVHATKVFMEASRACFAKAYEDKILSRKIIIANEDGGYVPTMTVKAARLLLERDKIFCFFISSGTSSTLALNALLEEQKIPLIGAGSQADAMAVPPKRYIFQTFTTFSDQMKIVLDYIIEKSGKDAKVAIFYQDDEMGYDGLKGFQEQTKKYGMTSVAEVSFKRGAIDLSSQALKLQSTHPDWVLLHSMWVEGSKLLKEAQRISWQPQFIGTGAMVDENLFKLAGDAIHYGKPLFGVATLHPWNGDSWGAKEYRDTLKKYEPDAVPTTFGTWGYGWAKVLVEGLRRIEGEPTREKLIHALETFKDVDTGIFPPLTFGPNLRKGSKGGMIVVVKENTFVPMTGWRDVK